MKQNLFIPIAFPAADLTETILKVFPLHVAKANKEPSQLQAEFQAVLPFVNFSINNSAAHLSSGGAIEPPSAIAAPTEITFSIVLSHNPSAFKFFFDMISHWLVPGKRLHISSIYAIDFKLKDICENIYTVSEIKLVIQDPEELAQIKKNLPIIEAEIRLGIHSTYYSQRILEIKGLTTNEKTAWLQQRIADLVRRRPKYFDFDLLVEMQHILIICCDEFKASRSLNHLCRIISIHYLYRREMLAAISSHPDQRHFRLKIFRARVADKSSVKPVLGLLIAFNFLKDREMFDQRHLLNAIKTHIPHVEAFPGSFFANRLRNESIVSLYLEVYKTDESEFTSEEFNLLKHELPHDLQEHVETPIHSIFMPRNEEEVLRNIVQLSKELNSPHAPAQVIITFDEQTSNDLIFTVIVLRIISPAHTPTLEQLFNARQREVEYLHDSSRILNRLRKNLVKEATVFRLKIFKSPFLRRDFSLNLVKARQRITEELSDVLGYFRDFNGGTLAREREALLDLKQQLKGTIKYSDLLLENFFHSLFPSPMRSLLETSYLKELFTLLLTTHRQSKIKNSFPSNSKVQLYYKNEENNLYVVIRMGDNSHRSYLHRCFQNRSDCKGRWASAFVLLQHVPYSCYLLQCNEKSEHAPFIALFEQALRG